ncbi:MAG: hypothetical protein HC912_00570 [Saprospiraceae bacterium]|nr:hypothetical protein [Saprospiraceae bacterium]
MEWAETDRPVVFAHHTNQNLERAKSDGGTFRASSSVSSRDIPAFFLLELIIKRIESIKFYPYAFSG